MTPGPDLFPRDRIVGMFRGFREGGMEFHADLVLPYRSSFHNVPMHGQFVLVQLETPEEAVLGRISSLSSEGRLTGPSGEEFSLRAIREQRPIPEELREDYLRYRVNIRVLGVYRNHGDQGLVFVASHRRLPHVGSPIAFPSGEVLRHIAGHYEEGADLGFLAFGEYVFSAGDARVRADPRIQVKEPATLVKFPVESLVARRTFVFARAGFGKSNLNKLLFSTLYAGDPVVEKRGGRKVPVGTIIFDPDGEYFWPDDKGRPGLCDVPGLEEKLLVFTNRAAPSPFYQSFVVGGIKLDVRRFRPADVISIALPPEKQDQQNIRKLRAMNDTDWAELVDAIDEEGNATDLKTVKRLLRLEDSQDPEAYAARANMTMIVRMLHDRSSQMVDLLLRALTDGKLCVIDISQLRGGPSLVLAGLILRRIFDRNQEEFTKAEPRTLPTIAVIEEAQSVLHEKSSSSQPFIEWVKEGRKYDLGAMLITQQPGSIPMEILSQGDNWFVFHLLSAADLNNVRYANAHFSEDLLSALLNEPIPGQGVVWSSVAGKPYPVPERILLFEEAYRRRDPDYRGAAIDTYAARLRGEFDRGVAELFSTNRPEPEPVVREARRAREASREEEEVSGPEEGAIGPDALREAQARAIRHLAESRKFHDSLKRGGIPWGVVVGILEEGLPPTMDDRRNVAHHLVARAVSEILGGEQRQVWDTEKRETKSGRPVTFIDRLEDQESRA